MHDTNTEFDDLVEAAYQPKTGERCSCRRGVQRDNCPNCEGTGWRVDFQAIRNRAKNPKASLDTRIARALSKNEEFDDLVEVQLNKTTK